MKKALLALALAAVIGTGVAQAPARSATSAQTPPTARQTATPSWQLVSTASDVNGNGRIDYISLRKTSATVCTVKVTTDAGRVSARHLHNEWDNPCQFHGSAPFDPVKGAEISIVTGWGAHTPWHVMLTWRNGEIVVQRSPHRTRWTVDSTVMVQEGIRRTRNAGGQIRLVHTSVGRDARPRWTGTREVYAYTAGRWVVTSTKNVALDQAEANRIGGWHVRYLPRFAD